MQEINNDLALQVRSPQIESATDALEKNVRISDVVAQVNQRNAESADYRAQAPLRALQLQNQTQTLTENNLLKQTTDQAMELDENHHARLNEDKAYAFLQSQQVPGVGSAGYLMPRVKKMADQSEAETQQALIDHTTKQNALLKTVADPMENFQKSSKTPADWAALKANVIPADPGLAKVLGPTYIPETHDPIIKQIVDQKAQQDDIAEKLSKAQQERSLALTTPEGQAKEIQSQVDAYTKRNGGKPPDQPTMDAIEEGVMQKAGFTGWKVARKTQGQIKQVGRIEGPNLPPGATGMHGEALDRSPGLFYSEELHPDGSSLGFTQNQFSPKAPSTQELKDKKAQEGYAFTLGKSASDLNPEEKVEADKWYRGLTGTETDKQRMIALASSDPTLFSFVTGHQMPGVTKPVTPAEKATILGRVNASVAKEFPTEASSPAAQAYKATLLKELSDHGVDLNAAAPSPAPQRPAAPLPGSTYGPTESKVLTADAFGHKKGETIRFHKNFATGLNELVP